VLLGYPQPIIKQARDAFNEVRERLANQLFLLMVQQTTTRPHGFPLITA